MLNKIKCQACNERDCSTRNVQVDSNRKEKEKNSRVSAMMPTHSWAVHVNQCQQAHTVGQSAGHCRACSLGRLHVLACFHKLLNLVLCVCEFNPLLGDAGGVW